MKRKSEVCTEEEIEKARQGLKGIPTDTLYMMAINRKVGFATRVAVPSEIEARRTGVRSDQWDRAAFSAAMLARRRG
jgi:hypothetical protein